MTISIDQALQQQVREEIGDDETMKFPAKNIILQKFGAIPPVITAEEILYWEMRLEESNG